MSDTIDGILFAAEAAFPERPALIATDRAWSYRQLAASTREIAGRLKAEGVDAGDHVALLLDNSVEFVVAHYALAAIGAVIVPLNTRLRGTVLDGSLALSDPLGIVTSDARVGDVEALPSTASRARRVFVLDCGDREQTSPRLDVVTDGDARRDGHEASHSLAADDFAGREIDEPAVLFATSGTTGAPKGIRLSNRQVLFGIDAWINRWEFSERTASAMVAPFFHVVYNPLVLGAHRRGAAAVILDNLQVRFVAAAVERHSVTAIMGTPFFYAQLLNDARSLERDLSSLETLIYGAAPCPVPTIRALRSRFPEARLYNCYGLTETSSAVSCLDPAELEGREASVGRPHPGVEVSVRDGDDRPVPTGTVGEVYCRGVNVIDSYFRSTAPPERHFHDGWLRTGDIGRLDGDSYLYLMGRSDDVINIGGEKIYPHDIEAVLHQHPDVLEAAVALVAGTRREQVIKAFVVPSDRGTLDACQLRRHCLQQLPAALVPKMFETVVELPRNPSGKILRCKLGEQESE